MRADSQYCLTSANRYGCDAALTDADLQALSEACDRLGLGLLP